MKTITLALVSAFALASATAARADHAHGGSNSYYSPSVTIVTAPVAACPTPGFSTTAGFGFANGHWEAVTTKTWIPGRWTVGRDRWGRPVKVFENGYFAYRTERVWVPNRPASRGSYGWNR